MKVSYNWLQSYFKTKLPKPEKLAEVLTAHSFEVEDIEKKGSDYILDIDILPNRAHDCLSHIGIAKEVQSLLGVKMTGNLLFSRKGTKGNSSKKQNFQSKSGGLNIEVKDPKLCKRYIGVKVEGVQIKQSPKWLKDRIEAIGQKSINNIVDATNYVMFEIGQPLHAFDADKLDGNIIVRKGKSGEKITTLDKQNFEIDPSILVITDKKDVLAIAGIKGGNKAEVDSNTKNLILESANFEQTNIRKTSKRIGLRTESSLRFENGISESLAEIAMNRLVEIILEISGGKIISKSDFYPKPVKNLEIGLRVKDISKLIGIDVNEKEIVKILNSLGFDIKKSKKFKNDNLLLVIVPLERLDVTRKQDLIEEVARVYGYEKISSELPKEIIIPPIININFFYGDIIRNIMVSAGFSEVYNYSFANNGDVEIANPIAKDKKYMRNNLADGLYNNVKDNSRYFKSTRMFEIGKIFNQNSENISFAGIISNGTFYEVKGIVDLIMEKIGITNYFYQDHENKTADIRIGNTSVGNIFSGQNGQPAGWEISFEMLAKMANEEMEYKPISKYPAVNRDVSVFVPLNTKVIEVMDIIENTAGELLIDTDLFDIYEDKTNDRKSFAFHLIFQSHDKTLSEKEITDLMNKIISALDSNIDWEVRK